MNIEHLSYTTIDYIALTREDLLFKPGVELDDQGFFYIHGYVKTPSDNHISENVHKPYSLRYNVADFQMQRETTEYQKLCEVCAAMEREIPRTTEDIPYFIYELLMFSDDPTTFHFEHDVISALTQEEDELEHVLAAAKAPVSADQCCDIQHPDGAIHVHGPWQGENKTALTILALAGNTNAQLLVHKLAEEASAKTYDELEGKSLSTLGVQERVCAISDIISQRKTAETGKERVTLEWSQRYDQLATRLLTLATQKETLPEVTRQALRRTTNHAVMGWAPYDRAASEEEKQVNKLHTHDLFQALREKRERLMVPLDSESMVEELSLLHAEVSGVETRQNILHKLLSLKEVEFKKNIHTLSHVQIACLLQYQAELLTRSEKNQSQNELDQKIMFFGTILNEAGYFFTNIRSVDGEHGEGYHGMIAIDEQGNARFDACASHSPLLDTDINVVTQEAQQILAELLSPVSVGELSLEEQPIADFMPWYALQSEDSTNLLAQVPATTYSFVSEHQPSEASVAVSRQEKIPSKRKKRTLPMSQMSSDIPTASKGRVIVDFKRMFVPEVSRKYGTSAVNLVKIPDKAIKVAHTATLQPMKEVLKRESLSRIKEPGEAIFVIPRQSDNDVREQTVESPTRSISHIVPPELPQRKNNKKEAQGVYSSSKLVQTESAEQREVINEKAVPNQVIEIADTEVMPSLPPTTLPSKSIDNNVLYETSVVVPLEETVPKVASVSPEPTKEPTVLSQPVTLEPDAPVSFSYSKISEYGEEEIIYPQNTFNSSFSDEDVPPPSTPAAPATLDIQPQMQTISFTVPSKKQDVKIGTTLADAFEKIEVIKNEMVVEPVTALSSHEVSKQERKKEQIHHISATGEKIILVETTTQEQHVAREKLTSNSYVENAQTVQTTQNQSEVTLKEVGTYEQRQYVQKTPSQLPQEHSLREEISQEVTTHTKQAAGIQTAQLALSVEHGVITNDWDLKTHVQRALAKQGIDKKQVSVKIKKNLITSAPCCVVEQDVDKFINSYHQKIVRTGGVNFAYYMFKLNGDKKRKPRLVAVFGSPKESRLYFAQVRKCKGIPTGSERIFFVN